MKMLPSAPDHVDTLFAYARGGTSLAALVGRSGPYQSSHRPFGFVHEGKAFRDHITPEQGQYLRSVNLALKNGDDDETRRADAVFKALASSDLPAKAPCDYDLSEWMQAMVRDYEVRGQRHIGRQAWDSEDPPYLRLKHRALYRHLTAFFRVVARNHQGRHVQAAVDRLLAPWISRDLTSTSALQLFTSAHSFTTPPSPGELPASYFFQRFFDGADVLGPSSTPIAIRFRQEFPKISAYLEDKVTGNNRYDATRAISASDLLYGAYRLIAHEYVELFDNADSQALVRG